MSTKLSNDKVGGKVSITEAQRYCIHIFRRDYRLSDNTSLLAAIKKGYIIIPVFIFTPGQIEDRRNSYKSHTCLRFLIESLEELDQQLHSLDSQLRIFYGNDDTVVRALLSNNSKSKINKIAAVSFNRDYTAYAHKRDSQIAQICRAAGCEVISMDDTLLQPLGTVCTGTGSGRKPYTKFTPFYRAAKQLAVAKPSKRRVLSRHLLGSRAGNAVLGKPAHGVSGIQEITGDWKHIHGFYNLDKVAMPDSGGRDRGGANTDNKPGKKAACDDMIEPAGRTSGLRRLAALGKWKAYGECRDQLIYETTHLSAYLKFGCISVREAYWNIRSKIGRGADGEPLLRQLYWRDFFYVLSAAYPRVYQESLDKRRHGIRWWSTDSGNWKAWTTGMTGYPIVDACMRELNATGYMHNRGRLIASNFLVRLLHINWQDGERYFATHLYDYDPAQNNFGWQVSSAVSGTESRPISQTLYNPWLQARKYDSDARFIKRWCPELESVPASDLMNWDTRHVEWLGKGCVLEGKYPMPIVDYKEEKKKDGELFGY